MSELLMQFGASAAEGGWVLNRNEPIFLIEQLQLLQLMSKEKIPTQVHFENGDSL